MTTICIDVSEFHYFSKESPSLPWKTNFNAEQSFIAHCQYCVKSMNKRYFPNKRVVSFNKWNVRHTRYQDINLCDFTCMEIHWKFWLIIESQKLCQIVRRISRMNFITLLFTHDVELLKNLLCLPFWDVVAAISGYRTSYDFSW